MDAAGNMTQMNSPGGIPIVSNRTNEEIESVLNVDAVHSIRPLEADQKPAFRSPKFTIFHKVKISRS